MRFVGLLEGRDVSGVPQAVRIRISCSCYAAKMSHNGLTRPENRSSGTTSEQEKVQGPRMLLKRAIDAEVDSADAVSRPGTSA